MGEVCLRVVNDLRSKGVYIEDKLGVLVELKQNLLLEARFDQSPLQSKLQKFNFAPSYYLVDPNIGADGKISFLILVTYSNWRETKNLDKKRKEKKELI